MEAHALSAYVASRRIGEATITIICEGAITWAPELQVPEAEWRHAMPEANAHGEISLDCTVVHIAIDGASILLDPGFDDPSVPQQRESDAQAPACSRTPGLQAALAGLGIRPDEISHVLISHAHDDHFAGVTVERNGRSTARFPHARYLLARRDWEGNPERVQPDSELMRRLGTIERLGLLELVDGDREVVPGVTMMHAPGETPGHSIVRLRSADGSFYYVGDLFHHPCEVAHLDWVSAGRDQAAMRSSRDRLIAEAAPNRGTIVFAHAHFPAWGRIVRAGNSYRWERL